MQPPKMSRRCNNSSVLCSRCETASRNFQRISDRCLNFSKRVTYPLVRALRDHSQTASYRISDIPHPSWTRSTISTSNWDTKWPFCIETPTCISASTPMPPNSFSQGSGLRPRLKTFLVRISIEVISPWHSCVDTSPDPNGVSRSSKRKHSPQCRQLNVWTGY